MNAIEAEVLTAIYQGEGKTQRELSQKTNFSLGKINQMVHNLMEQGLVNGNLSLTNSGLSLIHNAKPKRAVILAAGYGMRMVPISSRVSKGLLEVNNERLIERLIEQLHDSAITDITIVVGFMKEKYEYLIDKFNVNLIVNPQYSEKNNLYSLYLARQKLADCYIIPCDLYFRSNPFNSFELYSWYLFNDQSTVGTKMLVNKHMKIKSAKEQELGNVPIGLAYVNQTDTKQLMAQITEFAQSFEHTQDFWEICLFGLENFSAKIDVKKNAVEINKYEDLRRFDPNSKDLKSEPLRLIEKCLHVSIAEIQKIKVLKKGMTNRSFSFECRNKTYIMRIPGEGTDKLIDRKNEANVYSLLKGTNMTDPVKYINAQNGYKLTEFIEGARNCDPFDSNDVLRCMAKLRAFHEFNLYAEQNFDLVGQMKFYEELLPKSGSVYPDYEQTKDNVEKLIKYVEKIPKKKCLCHIDANSDNFIFFPDKDGKEAVRLIDWEYAGMQDPDLDIAMFAIYAMYDREHVDQLIDAYYVEGCSIEIRTKIYCYIAISGLLWSNWCEYKSSLGVEFGSYSLWQYHYAKEYFGIVNDMVSLEEQVGGK